MHVYKVFFITVLILNSTVKNILGIEQNGTDSFRAKFDFEMLTGKMVYMQQKLIEMNFTIKEDLETLDQKLTHQETLLNGLLWAIDQKLSGAIHQLSQALSHNFTVLHNHSNKLIAQHTSCSNHEQMRMDIKKLTPKNEPELFPGLNTRSVPYPSCKQEISKRSRKYFIQPTENHAPFLGYCEQARFGGGWLVVQHRYNGFLDFQRSWAEYRNGFGNVEGEHWLGLERLHRLTSARSHELLVELEDFSGNCAYARYTRLQIGSEVEQYPIKELGSYTGTAGDSLKEHRGMKFTTNDRDNDARSSGNCAADGAGGWWFNNCKFANLNGLYTDLNDSKALIWYHYKSADIGLAYSRIMIRET